MEVTFCSIIRVALFAFVSACLSGTLCVCVCVCTWLLKCKNAFPSSSLFPRVKVSFVARKIPLKKMKRQIFNCAYKDNTNSLSRTLKSFLASFIMIFLFFLYTSLSSHQYLSSPSHIFVTILS